MLFYTCDVKAIPVPSNAFVVLSNCPSPSICYTLKAIPLYVHITCLMDMEIVAVFSFLINSAVPKCMPFDIVMTKGIPFMYMMYYVSQLNLLVDFHCLL